MCLTTLRQQCAAINQCYVHSAPLRGTPKHFIPAHCALFICMRSDAMSSGDNLQVIIMYVAGKKFNSPHSTHEALTGFQACPNPQLGDILSYN